MTRAVRTTDGTNPSSTQVHREAFTPGQTSQSAQLRRLAHPVPSALGQPRAISETPHARDGNEFGGSEGKQASQYLGTPLGQKPPASEPSPAFGEDKGVQRRFSVEQYIAMWEKEQGRKMSAAERETLSRGCIGITALNLHGGGRPLDSAVRTLAKFEMAHEYMRHHNELLDDAAKQPGSLVGRARYILFASLFWSNQSPNYRDRFEHDNKAFLPDPATGEIDMNRYAYRARARVRKDARTGVEIKTSYVNYDYGFWDEASQCFWHANHAQYKDPVSATAYPMKVLQSTRERFAKGYSDFDRIVFCVALAENYDPALAALTHAGAQ